MICCCFFLFFCFFLFLFFCFFCFSYFSSFLFLSIYYYLLTSWQALTSSQASSWSSWFLDASVLSSPCHHPPHASSGAPSSSPSADWPTCYSSSGGPGDFFLFQPLPICGPVDLVGGGPFFFSSILVVDVPDTSIDSSAPMILQELPMEVFPLAPHFHLQVTTRVSEGQAGPTEIFGKPIDLVGSRPLLYPKGSLELLPAADHSLWLPPLLQVFACHRGAAEARGKMLEPLVPGDRFFARPRRFLFSVLAPNLVLVFLLALAPRELWPWPWTLALSRTLASALVLELGPNLWGAPTGNWTWLLAPEPIEKPIELQRLWKPGVSQVNIWFHPLKNALVFSFSHLSS